jgi:branched-subunit amino acid ABC-type transport system permease component
VIGLGRAPGQGKQYGRREVQHFLGFAIPGVPYGCTYAIVAVGLVLTYQATGVFNFAFGAQAYTSAFVYTKLVQDENLPIWLAFLISVVILAPLLGLAFDHFLFRKIPNTNTTAKLVTGISLFVGIPFLLPVLFGAQNLYNPPSVIFNPNTVYFHVIGTPVNGIYLSALVTTALVLIALVILMRFTNLGLQMRGAVESRRLVALDGVNAGRVVATAWAISSFMAGLAGVMLAPLYNQLQFTDYATLLVAAFAAAAWASLRSLPIAALVGILMGVADTVLQGYLPASSTLSAAVIPSLPFIVLVGALLLLPGMRSLDDSKDPLASVDPPPPPTTATLRAPQLSRIIRPAWYVLFAAFCVSMLTWIPQTWESVFNAGLAFSTIFLSITLITGMGGQLSLCQATLAGVGAFTAAQLANHLGLSLLVGGIVGALLAAVVAVVLAVASLRLKGLGLALMTIAAALFFDNSVFTQGTISNGHALTIESKWVGLGLFNPNGHSLFVLLMVVLVISTLGVLLIRSGTTGQYLSAMRGSETAAAGLGINLTWQRILIFALSGAVAGIGGTLLIIQQESVNASQFTYELSLAFVVIVVTTGVSTVEGAIQGGMGFVVIQQLLTYLPARFGGNSLTIVLFAFGALTYAAHPEGILEFQKRRWTLRFERLLFGDRDTAATGPPATLGPPTSAASGPGRSPSAVGNITLDLSAGDHPGGGGR